MAVFEFQKVEEALGWRVFSLEEEERVKTISKSDEREIMQLKNGSKIYLLNNVPELSADEAKLVGKCIDEYRKLHSNGKKLSAKDCLDGFCEEKNIVLDEEQQKYVSETLESVASQEGMLSKLLKDDDLEEIAIIGIGKAKPVHVFDSSFGWLKTNLYFSSEEEVKKIVNAMSSSIGRRITLQKPRLNAVLRNGARLNACVEPAAVSGPSVTIRKFKKNPLTPTDLHEMRSVSLEQMAFIWMAIQSDCSILICGNTGSGKTTLLNSIMNFVPKNERLILVEETPELNIPHTHFVKLATADGLEIGMQELIVNTLRMRPDRVIVGEIRNREEMKAFTDTLLAGQGKGTYATFHAQSGEEAIARMMNLGTMESDLSSLDLIITQKRWSSHTNGKSKEQRKLIEVSEPLLEKGKLKAQKIFDFDFGKNKFFAKGKSAKIEEKIFRTFGIKRKEIPAELRKRADFLELLLGKNQGEFFNAIQKY